jgi:hypothetical protein
MGSTASNAYGSARHPNQVVEISPVGQSQASFSGHGAEFWRCGVGPRQEMVEAALGMTVDEQASAIYHASAEPWR